MNNINTLLRQYIKIIKSFDHPITRDEIEIYGFNNCIRNLRTTPCNTSTDLLFDFGRYTHDKKFNHIGIIKVSSELLWYIYFGGNIRFKTDLTEEEIFQQSTVNNFYDLEPDVASNISELISLLEHLWK
ncbi:hypothetical protein pEaSNUABM47_00481 [Erwinia phage pEa_SNUABM_47]|uniref:Uncharacterized protein n=1 Tax=Erwinia phage pEa_SNUABM_47 TaxID=2768774 RepID=A0A7L8ZNA7_9CAUD|nr:hypothetical protein pEaSNUABM47_00481 [Erwinia phage pEa_SNUABM_47]